MLTQLITCIITKDRVSNSCLFLQTWRKFILRPLSVVLGGSCVSVHEGEEQWVPVFASIPFRAFSLCSYGFYTQW